MAADDERRAEIEAGIEAATRAIHERLCGCAATKPEDGCDQWCDSIYPVTAERAIAAYLSHVPPSRDGTVAVEDVARWLQHVDRLDEIAGARVGLPMVVEGLAERRRRRVAEMAEKAMRENGEQA